MGDVVVNGSGFRLEDDDSYQPVCTPPQEEQHSSDMVTNSSESTGVGSDQKSWHRLLREFRVVEYAFAIVLYIIARRLGKWMTIHRLPMYMLIIVSLAIAIVINLCINYACPMLFKIRVIEHDFRDFLLSLGQAITLSTFLVNFMKNMTGRFRPCFCAMCGWNYDVVWDGVTDLCSDHDGDDEGRKSFPSGHSSFVWSVMGVLTLYLLGRARLTSAEQSKSIVQEGVRTFKLFFCFLPCLAAAWVAITRSTDNRHHYSDIVAGSVIGAAAACLAYSHNYGSIYAWEFAGLPWEAIHERRKAKLKDGVQAEDGNCSNRAEHVIGMNNRGFTAAER